MINPLNPSAPISGSNQAKIDKEKLKEPEPTELQKTIDKYKSNGISSGNKNLCAFGEFNSNFIKDAKYRNSI